MRALGLIAKVVLVAVTLLFLASIGGGMLVAAWFLVPLHWWAAQRSGPVGTGGWAFLAAASMGEVGAMLGWLATSSAAVGAASGLIAFAATGLAFVARRARAATSADADVAV